MNPLKALSELGQSVWYDYIRRDIYEGPVLKKMIEEDGLKGMTSNPTIFEKAIADSDLYDDDIRRFGGQHKSAADVFESLEVSDVRGAADAFRKVYDATGGDDGFVSIEVGPGLALDTEGSLEEARRLWQSCARPNVMVKIPGTEEGIPAIRQCLAEGININITLLFSVPRYRQVMEAYLSAMEERVEKGKPVDRIRSVASFFVSRVDTNVDKKLDAIIKDEKRSDADRKLAKDLRSKFAIANARIAYEAFEEIFGEKSERFAKLKAKGVHAQRPLWASTSTKDPALPDLYYMEALIAPRSVNTVPPETFTAYRDHGDPKVRIHDDLDAAHAAFESLKKLGIDDSQVYRELEEEGVKKFSDSYSKLLQAVEGKEAAVRVS
jgi:transaldolase